MAEKVKYKTEYQTVHYFCDYNSAQDHLRQHEISNILQFSVYSQEKTFGGNLITHPREFNKPGMFLLSIYCGLSMRMTPV